MIPDYTTPAPHGLLPGPQAFFLDPQPVFYLTNSTQVQGFATMAPVETYLFGAKVVSNYYEGPTVKQRGWDVQPHLQTTMDYAPIAGGDAATGLVDVYIEVAPDLVYDGPGPFPAGYYNHGQSVTMYFAKFVDDIGKVLTNTSYAITVRAHVVRTTYPAGSPTAYPHVHDYLFNLGNEQIVISFDITAENSSVESGDYLDHLEFIYNSSTLANWYPSGHPLATAGTFTTTSATQVTLFDFTTGGGTAS